MIGVANALDLNVNAWILRSTYWICMRQVAPACPFHYTNRMRINGESLERAVLPLEYRIRSERESLRWRPPKVCGPD